MAVFSHRLPFLDSEPRTVGIAPPPYRSCHDDDSTSGRYSDSSTTSSALKRRASWTNFVEADENLNKFKVNVYPKVSSQSTTASVVSSQMAHPLPNKVPLSTRNPMPAGSVHGSSLSMSQSFHGGPNPSGVNYHARIPSRQNSYNSASNSMVSEFFVMPPGSYQKLNYASPMPAGATPIPLDNPRGISTTSSRPKRDRMGDLRTFWSKPATKLICALITLILIIGVVLAIVLPLALMLPNHYEFSWQAPEMLRNRQTGSNNIELDVKEEQARFNLRGAVPFHSNFLSVYDFRSNKVAIVDSALQSNGKTAICFVMDLNRQNLKDLNTLKRAARVAQNKNNQTQGWQEAWNFVPSPITNFQASSVFKPDIQECRNARWVELSYVNSNQKPTKCSDCYDFCLPDYGVERDVIRNEEYLNIVRRNCFYMFVPEWKNYAQAYPNVQQQGYQATQNVAQQNLPYLQPTGNFALPGYSNQPGMQPLPVDQFGNPQQGHLASQGLPQSQPGFANNQQMQIPGQQGYNQQQFVGTGGGGGGSGVGGGQNAQESRWISLANVPQQVVNRTGEILNQGRQQVTQWGQQIGQNLGILPNQPQTFTPSSNQDRDASGIYQQHNLNGFDYQQRPLVQSPAQTANLNGFAGQNVGMGPSYNVQQGQAPYNGPQSPQQRPLLPSQVFNPPTVQQQNERIAQQTNQNVLPSNPSDYFRQQQNLQQQYRQLTPQQQMQLTNQQSLGVDLSATIPPGQGDLNRDLQFLQNWGR